MRLNAVESRFVVLICQHKPITSGELVKLCEKESKRKKSATHTALQKLCNKGIFQSDGDINSTAAYSSCTRKKQGIILDAVVG